MTMCKLQPGSESADSHLLTGLLAGFTAALLWGIWPVISRLGIQTSMTPYDVTFIRFAVSSIVLLPVFFKYGLEGISFTGAALLAIGAGAPYAVITIIGLQYTHASHSGLVVPSFNIVFSTFGAAVFLSTLPTRWRLAGLSLILLGCGTIFVQSLNRVSGAELFGDLLYVLAGFVYAIYTVSSQKYRIGALQAISIVSVFSAVTYIPVYLLFLPKGIAQATVPDIVMQVVFQGLVTAVAAIYLYSISIRILGAARAVVFLALMPVFAMVSAIPVLGEWPTTIEWVALAMIVLGIFTALNLLRFPRKDPQACLNASSARSSPSSPE
jgi:drug/metabolite transporter (DMT)-like permease